MCNQLSELQRLEFKEAFQEFDKVLNVENCYFNKKLKILVKYLSYATLLDIFFCLEKVDLHE